MTMDEQAVRAFWSMHPLRGDAQLRTLDDAFSGDHDAFHRVRTQGIDRSRPSQASPPVDCSSRSCVQPACSPSRSRMTRSTWCSAWRAPSWSGHRRSPARDRTASSPRRAASARAARRVPTRQRRPRATEPTTRSRACTTRTASAATPPTSNWSSATRGTCLARGRRSGGTSGLIRGRSDLASGHRLPPIDRAAVFAAHVDASKKQSAVRGGSQACTDPPRRRRATTRQTCRQRARTSPQQPDANAAPDDAVPTPSDDNVHRALNPREKRTTDGRGPTKLFTRLSTHESRRVDRGDSLTTRMTVCCWGLGCRGWFSRWRR